jgi:hypothetical protein
MPNGLRVVKGYIPWVGKVKKKRDGGICDSCRREPVGCAILSYEGVVRGTLILWIPSPNLGVTGC